MARLTHTRRRAGFTLIELLVVIGIIAILAALVTAGAGRVRSAQMVKATENGLTKLRLGVDRHWKAVLDQARDDGRKQPSRQTIPQEIWDWCNGDRDRTTALWAYMKLKVEFPQTFPEARSGVTINGYTLQAKATFGQVPAAAPTTLAEYRLQSAALLYIALSEGGGRGELFSADDVTNGDWDISGSKYKVFKDAWGQPICFERFTTSPDANGRPWATTFTPRGGVTTIDVLDPTYKLADKAYWETSPAAVGRKAASEAAVMPPLPPGGATSYTPAGFYTFNGGQNRMCAMISFGPDKNMDANPLGGDDIYSYRLHRQGNASN